MRTIVMRPLVALTIVSLLLLPSLVGAREFESRDRSNQTETRLTERINAALQSLCERLENSRLSIALPDFCAPEPPPPPVDACPNVPGTQESGPCADQECVAEGGTWNGESCDMLPPPPVDVCPNVPGDQENGPCADEECVADGGTWNGTSCDLPPPPVLPTLDFSATPSSIIEGESSTLEWDSEDADSCTASNGWIGSRALDGSLVVSPIVTTTYGLECTNADGSVSRNVTVTVSPPPPAGTGLVITEIMYNPEGTDTSHEWIEIKNGSTDAINLTSWTFFENGTNHGLTLAFGENAILEPGEFAVIAQDAVTFREPTDFPGFSGTLFDSSFDLSNTGETIAMKNSGGEIVDEVTYSSSTGADNDGNTLQLTTAGWIAAPPTPGEENASSS